MSKMKRGQRYGFGTVRLYYGPMIENMQVDDVVQVPVGLFDLETLNKGIWSFACARWGNRSIVTELDYTNRWVEVYRVK